MLLMDLLSIQLLILVIIISFKTVKTEYDTDKDNMKGHNSKARREVVARRKMR